METNHVVREYKDYAGGLESFASCANQCPDPEILLPCFFDKLYEVQQTGKYIVIKFDESDPASHLMASKGFDDLEYQKIAENFSSWCKQPEYLPKNLNFLQEILARILEIQADSFINASRQNGQIIVFIGYYEDDMIFRRDDTNFFNALVDILKLSMRNQHMKNSAYAEVQNIIDAKHQWEATVDVLDVLICLLDENGKVYRANKTLEKWQLGNVRCINKVDVHDLLHPDCHDPRCKLKLNWLQLWKSSKKSKVETCEFYDQLNQCELSMTLLRGKNSYDRDENNNFSTLVISDNSESKWALEVLQEHNEELYSQVQNQTIKINTISTSLQNKIHEHRQDRKTLQMTEERLLSLSAKLLTAQEEERKYIAAELHDGIGQSISAIKFNLENLLATKWTEDEDVNQKHNLQKIITRLSDTVEDVRRISMGLRPSMIDELGLLITVQWLCRTFQNDFKDISLDTQLNLDEEKISEIQKVSIFRIIQEALNNIAKYSQADKVSIVLQAKEDTLYLAVEDNGIGFFPDPGQLSNGFGLCSMKERAKLSRGDLFIQSSPDNGTLIKAVWKHLAAE